MHVGSHLRDEFAEWVDQGMPDHLDPYGNFGGERSPVGCSGSSGAARTSCELCDQLDMPWG